MQSLNQATGSRFEQSVLAAAEKNAKEIMLKAQKYRSDTLRGINMVQTSELNRRTDAIKEKNDRRVAKEEQDSRRKLLIYRDELTKNMFCNIEKKLIELSSSENYRKKMSKRLTKLNDRIYQSIDYGQVTQLLINESDKDYFEKLFGNDHSPEVVVSKEIRLGGFILNIDRTLFDYTLDSALELAKEKFYNNNDFVIE